MSAPAVELREIILAGQRVAYTLRRSARKTLGLRIDHRGLTVGVPLRVGLREAEAFIRSHAEWVVDKLHARPQPQPVERFDPVDGAALPVLGEAWQLRVGRGNNRVLWHEQGPERILELALRAGADGAPRAGYLTSVREVEFHAERLDLGTTPLDIHAECLSGDGNHLIYSFRLETAGRLLITGRASVMLDAGR